MQMIPTRVHGILDYSIGALLIAAPWIFGFDEGGVKTWLPVALGIGIIVYSLLTDYEFSVVKAIPMPVHLMLDLASGALLAVSPWLFGFSDDVWAPHLIVGLIIFGVAAFSQTRRYPETSSTGVEFRRHRDATPSS